MDLEMISHYRIIRPLGAGGMGEVYLAQDTKLDRKVAIKFLPRKASQDEQAKQRLAREAQVAASLDHPNLSHSRTNRREQPQLNRNAVCGG